jgi:hypothetical protein
VEFGEVFSGEYLEMNVDWIKTGRIYVEKTVKNRHRIRAVGSQITQIAQIEHG